MGIVLIILILVRFYIFPFFFSNFDRDYNYWYLSTIIPYTIIVISILIYQSNGLSVLHDHFSLWMIVLGCFFSIGLGGENTAIYKICLILLGIVLLTYIIVYRKDIKMPGFWVTFSGILWSIFAVFIIALIYALLDQTFTQPFPQNLLSIIVYTFVSQFSVVSVIEEACFRGLLFSFLIMSGCNENKALFIQAILFWGIHYFDIQNLSMFFIIIPLGVLFTTLIIKKYKMLYLSIMMHTLINVFTTLLVNLINRYLF